MAIVISNGDPHTWYFSRIGTMPSSTVEDDKRTLRGFDWDCLFNGPRKLWPAGVTMGSWHEGEGPAIQRVICKTPIRICSKCRPTPGKRKRRLIGMQTKRGAVAEISLPLDERIVARETHDFASDQMPHQSNSRSIDR